MGQEYGEKIRYNPNFKGPVHNRSCTDIVWLIIFILFLGGWGYVGYYSYIHGNVEKLLAPIDSKGRRCGIDSGLQNKKYLVFFDIVQCLQPGVTITGCNTPQVCVEKCPQQTINFASSEEFSSYRSSMVCTEDVDINTLSYNQALDYIEQKKCAKSVLESKAVLGRCIPVDNVLVLFVNNTAEATSQLINTHQLASQIVQDLVKTRWYLLGGLGVVVIICLIYIALLRWVAGPVVWTSILGLFAALIYSLYVCYQQYAYYKKHQVTAKVTTNLKGYVESLFTDYKAWMVILIIVAVFTLILLLIVIFLRNRIVLACALIKEGSKAVVAVKTTVFFPIIPWLIQCVVILYGILVLMYLLSIGESAFKTIGLQDDTGCTCTGEYSQMKDYESCIPEKFTSLCFSSGSNPCKNASCHFTGIVNPNSNYYFHAVNLLGFFWALFFIGGVADMMLASTFSTWYWTFHKRDLPFFTLTSGIGRTLRYHLGTVAFGSLIIAIVRVIRVILEYVDRKLKKYENPVTKCIMCCCKCCLLCLENFLKFINKNAYIMCAVHGTSFCTSARDAFSLLMRNIVRVVVLDKVTNFIFFLSKVLISVGIGFGVNYLFTYIFVTQEDPLHYYAVPAVILSIATYLVSTVFFNVYSMAIDTLFLCFLEDNERNDGSPEKPYFMSKNLMKILGKKNKL